MAGDVKWIQVWEDRAELGLYLLTLRAFTDGSFELIDPQGGGEVIERFYSQEEAVCWLEEDEYGLVGGLAQSDSREPTRLGVLLGGGPAAFRFSGEIAEVKVRIPEVADLPDVLVYLLWSNWSENLRAASFIAVDESSLDGFRRWLLDELPDNPGAPALD